MSDSTTSCPYETSIDWTGDVVVDDKVCFTGAELGRSNVGRIFFADKTVVGEITAERYGSNLHRHTVPLIMIGNSRYRTP